VDGQRVALRLNMQPGAPAERVQELTAIVESASFAGS